LSNRPARRPASGTRLAAASQRPENLWLLSAGLLLLGPVVFLPGALDRFVLIKAAVVMVGTAGAFALARGRGRLPAYIWALIAAAAVWLVLAALTSAAPLAQLIGREPRFEGLVMLPVYVAALAASARLFGPRSSASERDRFLLLLMIASALVAALAALELLGLRPLSSSVSRPGSLFGNASDEGAWGAMVAAMFGAFALRRRDWVIWTGLGTSLFVAVGSGSRGALAGLIGGALTLVVLRLRRQTLLLVGAGLASVLVAAILIPATRARVFGGNSLANSTVGGRVELWRETLRLDVHHLLFGVGPSGFVDAIGKFQTVSWFRANGVDYPPDGPHNWLLQALSAGGVVLLAVGLAFAACLLVQGVRRAREPSDSPSAHTDPTWALGATAGLLAYAVALLFHVTSIGPAVTACTFGGVILAVQPRASTPWRWVASVVCAVFGIVLLIGALAEIPLKAAVVAAVNGDAVTADRNFRTAHALRPWDSDLSQTAGHALIAIAQSGGSTAVVDAGPWLSKAASATPNSVNTLLDLASVAELRGDYSGALGYLDDANRLAPNNPLVLLRRGVVHAEAKDYPSAESDLVEVTAILPTSQDAWSDLARVYRLQGRSSDAAAAESHVRGTSP
jgi:O-antigen ligase/Tfp pilus assembly protein PilF